MPEYLLTGTRPDGGRETVNVEADSADGAVARLKLRGHTEVVLHTDDVTAPYIQQRQVSGTFSPGEYLAIRDRRGYFDDVRFLLRKVYARGRVLNLVALGVLVARRTLDSDWGVLDWALLASLVFPGVYVAVAQLFSPVYRHRRLMEAHAWGRWAEVLRLLPKLESLMTQPDAASSRATALAGLGRLEEALATLAPFAGGGEQNGGVPEWRYFALLSDVYFAAGDHERRLAAHEAAAAVAPDNPLVLIDLARAVARYRGDAARARELLERARTHALSDVVAPHAVAAEGAVLLAERRPAEARDRLHEALIGMRRFRHASPVVGLAMDYARANLARAYAALGDFDSAEAEFAAALPRLKALCDDEMIARVETAVGSRVR